MPALKPGSKSLASVTFEPGVTRNGAMNSVIRLRLSSGMADDRNESGPAKRLQAARVSGGAWARRAPTISSAASPAAAITTPTTSGGLWPSACHHHVSGT